MTPTVTIEPASPPALVVDLFADVPDVMVCVKDAGGVYVAANRAFARRARRRRVGDVVGRRATDLFAADLAASYEAQDRAVLRTGLAVRNHLEVIADAGQPGRGRWYLTTKVASGTAEHGAVVIAVSVDAGLGDRGDDATGLRAAIELAHERCHERLTVGDLAATAGMSSDRLERAMRRTLASSPKQYLLRLRAERAARLLATTSDPIAHVAASCGYFDQSQMTRQFRAHIGMTPRRYREAATGTR